MTLIPDSERRQHQRSPLRTTAQVIIGNNPPVEVRTLDISIGGMCIVANANPKVGITFTIRTRIPQFPSGFLNFGTEVQVTHSVFSSNDGGFKIGLRFTHLPSHVASAIRAYIAAR